MITVVECRSGIKMWCILLMTLWRSVLVFWSGHYAYCVADMHENTADFLSETTPTKRAVGPSEIHGPRILRANVWLSTTRRLKKDPHTSGVAVYNQHIYSKQPAKNNRNHLNSASALIIWPVCAAQFLCCWALLPPSWQTVLHHHAFEESCLCPTHSEIVSRAQTAESLICIWLCKWLQTKKTELTRCLGCGLCWWFLRHTFSNAA